MSALIEYSRRDTIQNSAVGSRGGGSSMDDVLRRLGVVEQGISDLRSEVAEIRLDVASVRSEVAEVRAQLITLRTDVLPHLATKADIAATKADIASLETRIIKWLIATVLTAAGLAFTAAKFVH